MTTHVLDADTLLDRSHPHTATTRRLAEIFSAAGHDLFLVGGAVRDLLRGVDVDELDFATSARPATTLRLIESICDSGPYRIGEKFGTVGCRIDGYVVEITTYRTKETYRQGSRKPDVEFGQSIEDDLSRRDFTINAIACDPLRGRIVDPYSGIGDLNRGLVRAVGEAARRFEEDPLRLLRAVRFASRFGFSIEEHTWGAVNSCAASLEYISRERIRDEYGKILTSDNPVLGLTLLRDGDLITHSVPELLELTQMPDHGPCHPLSLWDHVMRVVAAVPAELEVRWAAVLHDIGKPRTRSLEANGRIRFYHHEEVGAQMAREILTGLRYPNSFVDNVSLLVATHMNLHAYSLDWSDGAVRRLMMRLGPLLPLAIQLARADADGHAAEGHSTSAHKFDELEARIDELGRGQTASLASPLSGDDLMRRYNLPPGPWIREVKQALLDDVIEGRLEQDDRERAWEVADALVLKEA